MRNRNMKKILTFVFKHPLGDCTNNGLSSKANNLDLYYNVTESDYEALSALDEDVLVLVERGSFQGRLLGDIAVPFSILKTGAWSMSGGNFVYTSDSRFPSDSPISVHDRVES